MTSGSGAAEAPLPDHWNAVVVAFDEAVLKGKVPCLDECFRGFPGVDRHEVVRALAEVLTLHADNCCKRGLEWIEAYTQIVEENPSWMWYLSEATHQLRSRRASVRIDAEPGLGYLHGQYQLVDRLPAGGFGSVYRAVHGKRSGGFFLKRPRHDKLRMSRRALEAEDLALQDLKGVKGVALRVDRELDTAGIPAIVTEYVEGILLEELARPETAKLFRWMTLLCQTVQDVHSRGVYHCDIKPENVIVRDRDSRPILVDFGGAQILLEGARTAHPELPPFGTPAYLAPEIVDPSMRAAGPAVDIFCLGGVLYFLMTKKPPFDGAQPSEVLQKVMAHDVDWKALDAAPYPAGLKRVCRTALERLPEHRYKSAGEMKEALQGTLYGRRYRAAEAVRHHYSTRKAGALALAGVILLVAYSFSRNHPAPVVETEKVAEALTELGTAPWRSIAEDNNINLGAVTEGDFKIEVWCPAHNDGAWNHEHEKDPETGTLVVTTSPHLFNMAQSLQFRVGRRPWSGLYGRNDITDRHFGTLEKIDFQEDGPVFLRLGGDGLWDGGVIAGPFRYDVSISDALQRDVDAFRNQQIDACQATRPFHNRAIGWAMHIEYTIKYEYLINEVRFGKSPDALTLVARTDEIRDKDPYYTDYPMPRKMALHESFMKHSPPVQQSPTIWAQVHFKNGRVSPVTRYDREP